MLSDHFPAKHQFKQKLPICFAFPAKRHKTCLLKPGSVPTLRKISERIQNFKHERVVFLIYTKRKYLKRYLGISDSLDAAIRHLQSADLSQLHKGRNEIDGDRAFVNRFDYQTMPQEQAIWEGHAKYGDIHVLLSGREKIGVTQVDGLKVVEQKPEEDFIGYEGDVEVWFPMTTEHVLIVYPEDAHMVKVMDGESSLVEKACYKFKV